MASGMGTAMPKGRAGVMRVGQVDGPVVAGPGEQGEIRDEEREAGRVEQRVQLAARDDLSAGERWTAMPNANIERHPEEDRDEGIELPEPRAAQIGAEHPEHDQLAVRDVDDAHDAEDDGQPHADHRVERAGQEPADEALDKRSP